MEKISAKDKPLLYDAQGHGGDVFDGEMDAGKVMDDPVDIEAWL